MTLDGSNSYDPNGNSIGFSWMQVGGNPAPLSNYNTANPIFIAPIVPYPTTLTFQLIVNNGEADSSPSVCVHNGRTLVNIQSGRS